MLDDRFSRPPATAQRCDLNSELLVPYLRRPTEPAAAVAGRMLATAGGLATRWMPSLATLLDELCAPPRVPEPGERYEEPDFTEADLPDWWEPYEDVVGAVIEGLEEPTYLSRLLARVPELAEGLLDAREEPLDEGMLASAMVHAAHRAWTVPLENRVRGDSLVIAVRTARRIDTPRVRCTDLLLVPAVVTEDIEATPARPVAVRSVSPPGAQPLDEELAG